MESFTQKNLRYQDRAPLIWQVKEGRYTRFSVQTLENFRDDSYWTSPVRH